MFSTMLNSDRWMTGRPAYHFISRVELKYDDYARYRQRAGHIAGLDELEALTLLKPPAEVILDVDLTGYACRRTILLPEFRSVLLVLWPYLELVDQSRLTTRICTDGRRDPDICMDLAGQQGRLIDDWVDSLEKVSHRPGCGQIILY